MTLLAPPPRRGIPVLRRAADVRRHTLLHHITVPQAWPAWCEAQGLAAMNPHGGLRLDQYQVIVRAVGAGMGVALVPTCLVEDELRSGDVCAPLAEPFHIDAGYFLCYPESKASLEPLVLFREWLHAEVAKARESVRPQEGAATGTA